MKNVDKIKSLEHEIGRYQKKVADQQSEIDRLTKELQTADDGAKQVNQLVDAVLAACAVQYGQEIVDDMEESSTYGQKIGWNILLDVSDLDKYEVKTIRKDGKYSVGVIERE